jgi:hypothetical protein
MAESLLEASGFQQSQLGIHRWLLQPMDGASDPAAVQIQLYVR